MQRASAVRRGPLFLHIAADGMQYLFGSMKYSSYLY